MKKGLIAVGLASAILLSACSTDGKMSESKEENFLSAILSNQQVYSQMTILGPRVEDNIDKLSKEGANELMFYYFDLVQNTLSNANQMGMIYYQDALKTLASGEVVEKIDTATINDQVITAPSGEDLDNKKVKYLDLNDDKFLKKIKDPDFKRLMQEVYASPIKIVEEDGMFSFDLDLENFKKEYGEYIPSEMVTYLEFFELQKSSDLYKEDGTLNYDHLINLIAFVSPLLEGYDHTYYAQSYENQIGVYYTYLLGLYQSNSLDETGKYKQELIDLYDKISADSKHVLHEETKDFIAALKANGYVPNEASEEAMDKILLKYMTQEYLDSYKSSNSTEEVNTELTEVTEEGGVVEVTPEPVSPEDAEVKEETSSEKSDKE